MWSSHAQCILRLAAQYDPLSPRGPYELRRPADQIPPCLTIPRSLDRWRIADLEADAALQRRRDGLELNIVRKPLGQVERDQVAFQGCAAELEGLFCGRAQGEDVVRWR